MYYYHGTSSKLKINRLILPNIYTKIIREDRSKNNDVVYITTSKVSAEYYANKAVEKFGGYPIIYRVNPKPYATNLNNNEYVCNIAEVISKES